MKKRQSRIQSLFESATQTIVGLAISFLIQVYLYKFLKINVSFEQNIKITMVFFIASLVRQYFIRRFFNKCKNK